MRRTGGRATNAAARLPRAHQGHRARPARRAGPYLVRGVPVRARDGDRGPALSRPPGPAEPVLLGAEHVRAARLRQRAAALQDGEGLRRLPEARRRARRLDRPGDRQHARRRREGLHAAARAGRARAAAARVAGRGASRRTRRSGARSGTCRRSFRPRTASALTAAYRLDDRDEDRAHLPPAARFHARRVPAEVPRHRVGLGALPDGEAWYAYNVREITTTDYTPAQIHEIGPRRGRAHPRRDAQGDAAGRLRGQTWRSSSTS